MLSEKLKKGIIEQVEAFEYKFQKYNLEGLLKIVEESEFNFYMAKLKGPMGMANFNGVYLDMDKIKSKSWMGCSEYLFSTILHELAHMKRMKKIGKKKIIEYFSATNFEDLYNHVLYEEMLADRYACIMFYKLNKRILNVSYTQSLHVEYNRERIKYNSRNVFGLIKNDESKYDEFAKFMIKEILE